VSGRGARQRSPTRSLALAGENRHMGDEEAHTLLGYRGADDWRDVITA